MVLRESPPRTHTHAYAYIIEPLRTTSLRAGLDFRSLMPFANALLYTASAVAGSLVIILGFNDFCDTFTQPGQSCEDSTLSADPKALDAGTRV